MLDEDEELTSESGELGLLSSASSSTSLRCRSPAIIDFRFKLGGVFPFPFDGLSTPLFSAAGVARGGLARGVAEADVSAVEEDDDDDDGAAAAAAAAASAAAAAVAAASMA